MNKLASTSLALLLASSSVFAHAQSASEPLSARAEVNFRYGSERSIMMTEMWVPILQDDVSVLYGDLRLMGDDQDNREGNVGLGYRAVAEEVDGVLGAHIWIDRRLTERGSTFHQITTGLEYLGEDFDVLLNGYIPLSSEKKYIIPNANPQGPALAGTGIVVDTDGTLLEESQHGFDIEFGWQLPFAQDYTDSARIYAGGYYFDGPNTEDIAGWRTRLAVDINADIQIGGRFQKDDERGSQGFLETTIRFPFGQKKSFRKEGLRARLDDSPERDIDIVTGDVVTDTGDRVAVINKATGVAQEVLHVNNTAGGGGDGSTENPFNSLAAAEAASSAHTIIYVNTGDGMNTNQDQGVTLNKTGQQLIGAGTNFVFDAGQFSTANGKSPTGLLIAPAGTAPVISNMNATSDGITITADDVTVAGVTVDGATRDGIVIEADGGAASAQNVTITDVTAQNNRFGIYVHGTNGGAVSAKVQRANATTNSQHGIAVYDDTAGTFEVDLGGGAMDSAGNNVLAGNTLEDLAVDYDGRALAVMNNWWGQASGPDQDAPNVGIDPQIYYGAPINDGLVGHWTFDNEWMAGTTAYDRSAQNNDGTLQGGLTLANQVAGPHGEALNFDGNDDRITVPYDASLDNPAAFTLLVNASSDINGSAYTDLGFVVDLGLVAPTGLGVMVRHTADNWGGYYNNNGGAILETSTVNAGQNDFLSLTYDGANIVMGENTNYIAPVASGIGTITNNPLRIGGQSKNTFSGTRYFDGTIDDIRYYTRALSNSEIAEIYRMDTTSTINASGFLTAAP